MKKVPQNVDTNVHDQLIPGTVLKGDILSNGNLKIDGRLIGSVSCKNRVVVGETGYIEGEIICQNIQIYGKIIGSITCEEMLVLKATADVHGDIKTSKLMVEIGASFSGNCIMVLPNKEETQTM